MSTSLTKIVIGGGLVVAAVIGGWAINNAWISDSPWWNKGSQEQLKVFTCGDTECVQELHMLQNVKYNGEYRTSYSQKGMEESIETAKDGISYIDNDALLAWQSKNGLGSKDANSYNYIYGFTIFTQTKQDVTFTDVYGYCYSKVETKSCIAFDNRKTQYRFEPENNNSF